MRHFSTNPLPHLLALLSITILLQSTTTLARPTEPTTELISLPRQHAPPPSLQPRGSLITYYNNLGAWSMVLTTAASILFDTTSLTPTSIPKLVDFFAKVAAQAATLSSTKATEKTALDFGEGAIQLAFVMRDGYGSPATIPWDLVANLATEFMLRADRGNPTAFRAQVLGPLKPNVLGGQPWIEVVLVVGGGVLMDGINWAIF